MSVMFIMIAVSLLLALSFLGAFIWATHNGQFDDPITPAMRILNEENNNLEETKEHP